MKITLALTALLIFLAWILFGGCDSDNLRKQYMLQACDTTAYTFAISDGQYRVVFPFGEMDDEVCLAKADAITRRNLLAKTEKLIYERKYIRDWKVEKQF